MRIMMRRIKRIIDPFDGANLPAPVPTEGGAGRLSYFLPFGWRAESLIQFLEAGIARL